MRLSFERPSTATIEAIGQFVRNCRTGRSVNWSSCCPDGGADCVPLQGPWKLQCKPATAILGLECLGCFAKDSWRIPAWILQLSVHGTVNIVMVSSLQINFNLHQQIIWIQWFHFHNGSFPLLQGDSVPLIKALSINVITSSPSIYDDLNPIELFGQLLPLLSASLFKLRDAFACPDVLGQIWQLCFRGWMSCWINRSWNWRFSPKYDAEQSLAQFPARFEHESQWNGLYFSQRGIHWSKLQLWKLLKGFPVEIVLTLSVCSVAFAES